MKLLNFVRNMLITAGIQPENITKIVEILKSDPASQTFTAVDSKTEIKVLSKIQCGGNCPGCKKKMDDCECVKKWTSEVPEDQIINQIFPEQNEYIQIPQLNEALEYINKDPLAKECLEMYEREGIQIDDFSRNVNKIYEDLNKKCNQDDLPLDLICSGEIKEPFYYNGEIVGKFGHGKSIIKNIIAGDSVRFLKMERNVHFIHDGKINVLGYGDTTYCYFLRIDKKNDSTTN